MKINPEYLIEKNPIVESLFMPLYFKAIETQQTNPLIEDPKAIEIVNSLDYNFDYIEKKNKAAQFHVIVRTKVFDEQVTKFIADTKNPLIINLGSGLDTRYTRIPSEYVKCWYDIDLPEVIKFRNHFFKNTDTFRSIGKSVLDFSWIKDISEDHTDSVLFIAEGLLMYFSEAEIREILSQINSNFPSAEMLCEVFHPKLLKFHLKNKKNNKDLSFTWGISDSKDLESLCPSVFVENEWKVNELYRERQKLIIRIISKFLPDFKNLVRIIKLRFNAK